jgi:voltage-gated potassium channel
VTKKHHHFFGRFFKGCYNLLLISLLLLFVFRPYDRGSAYVVVWKLLFTFTLLSALFNCNHNRVTRWIATIFGLPAFILTWAGMLYPLQPIYLANVLSTVIFLTICTTSIVYDVVLRARVTLETLRGVICAYFLVAFVFAFLYFMLEHLIPGSFYFSQQDRVPSFTYSMSEMIYFSFGTLLTIGFGDVTPTADLTQTFVVIEGIIGQFYIAILVARLVSVYSFYADKKLLKTLEKDIREH